MKEHRLERTGGQPVVFNGSVISRSTGRRLGGKDNNRYHDLTVYKTKGGNYVLHIEYITIWEGEFGHSDVEVFKNPVEVAEYFKLYDCCAHVQGFPDKPQYEQRQTNLMDWLHRKFETQVAEVLSDLEGAEERID